MRVYLADTYHDYVVREATPADIAEALLHRDRCVYYTDRGGNTREGYLVRYDSDDEGNEFTVALTDAEIVALGGDS